MFYDVSVRITNLILENASEDFEHKRDHIRYALETLFGELTKCIILFSFFRFFEKGQAFAIAFIGFSIIRLWSGGIHFKTYFGCLLGTLILYSLMIWFPLNLMGYEIYLLLFSLLTVLKFAPLTDIKRPITDRKRRNQTKIWSLVAIATAFGLSQMLRGIFASLFPAVLLIFTLQLFIGGILHEKQKKYV